MGRRLNVRIRKFFDKPAEKRGVACLGKTKPVNDRRPINHGERHAVVWITLSRGGEPPRRYYDDLRDIKALPMRSYRAANWSNTDLVVRFRVKYEQSGLTVRLEHIATSNIDSRRKQLASNTMDPVASCLEEADDEPIDARTREAFDQSDDRFSPCPECHLEILRSCLRSG